ncbi:MAG: GTPase HflX [Chrysiogenetes bacterium]|nr:GTPase HflX [Chrysiogenetes bacterium]
MRSLAEITADTGRQIGVLLDRRGKVRGVSVGSPHRITLPEFDRSRTRVAAARLAGFRFIHSHPAGDGLDPDDLSDLALLRLDAIGALTITDGGSPDEIEVAQIAAPAHDVSDTAAGGKIQRTGLVPWQDVEGDFDTRVKELERALSDQADQLIPEEEQRSKERAVLVTLATRSRAEAEARQAELVALAETAGVAVVGSELIRLRRPDAATLIGRGRIDELSIQALHRGANLIIFDRSLSPVQVKNLGEATELRVIDRTQLILDIFAQHARSKDGKLQVELAQLRYRMPRLVGRNPALSRLAGGIGGQGPGESKLEIDRRRARERVSRLERELRKLGERRQLGRKARGRNDEPLVSLVGYTNAGKSTLFNALTRGGALAANQLFATLDPTTRRMFLGDFEGRFPDTPAEVLASDTVGFIRELPEELVEAFRATLEELRDADLLLHVVDASSPVWPEQRQAVLKILGELELGDVPMLTVFNKADLLSEESREAPWPGLLVSAGTGEGLDKLREALAAEISEIRARGAREARRAAEEARVDEFWL